MRPVSSGHRVTISMRLERRLVLLRVLSSWFVAAMAAGILLRTRGHLLDLVTTRIDHCPQLGCDFLQHYLPQARLLFGDGLVFGWVYPPLLGLILRPLTGLADTAALRVWMGLQCALAAVLVVQCRTLLAARGRWTSWALALALVVTSLPVVHNLKWGQVSVLVAVGAWAALRQRGRLAIVLLGFLGALKLYPLVYAAAPLLRRELRFVVRSVFFAIAIGVLLPALVLGIGTTLEYFGAALAWRPDITAYLGGQALWPSLGRWFVNGRSTGLESDGSAALLVDLGIAGATGFATVARWILVLTPSVALTWVTLRRLRRPGLSTDVAVATTLVTATLAVGPGWHHYFAFLPLVLAVCLRSDAPRPRLLAIASWSITALPLVLLADAPRFYFHYSAWGGTTLAALLAGWALWTVPSDGDTAPPRPGRG